MSGAQKIRLGGAIAAAFGALALAGWALGLPLLASLGPNRVAMAPSTAVLFVLYGIAALLGASAPRNRRSIRAGLAITSAGALVALLLLILSLLGVRAPAEHLGFVVASAFGETPAGHMSPVTALCFLVASLSFLGSLPSSSARPRRAEVAWWAAGLLLATSCVLVLAYVFGSPLFYAGSFIPPAATSSLAFAALATALLGLAGRGTSAGARVAARFASVPRPLMLLLFLLAVGIVGLSGLYYRGEARRHRAGVEGQLAAVAELKAGELARWWLEAMRDASALLADPSFSSLMARVLDYPDDAAARESLRARLASLQAHEGYERISLLDATGVELLVTPAGRTPVSSVIARRTPEDLRSGKVTVEDFYRNERDGRVYLSVLGPYFDEQRRQGRILELRIDPEATLYPLLRRWPTTAQTAETLLVRRDGDSALFLNETKFEQHSALTLRIPLTRPEVAAVKAVLGQEGIVEAKDYRGVPVIAALRAVRGSPWFLVARIDAAEANAPLRERLWVMLVLVSGLLVAAAAGVGVAWREQRVRDLKERVALERETAWLHGVIARSLNEVYVFDPETLRFLFVNLGACRNLGYTQEELAGLTPLDLKPEFTPETFRDLLEPLRNEAAPPHVFETIHRRKNGSEYPVEVNLQLVDSGARAAFLAIISDITERKKAEREILVEKAFSEALLDSLPGIFYLFDQTGRFLRWNRALETVSGYAGEEIAAMRPLDFFTGEDRALVERAIAKVFAAGSTDVEAALVSKDGRRTPHYFVGLRFHVDGAPCCIGTGIDVTARRLLEEQLRQSQKIEAIGLLAGGLAHDFNNILGVILGHCEMAQRQLPPDHAVRQRVDQVAKAAERAAALTRQLLAFSRKQVLQPRVLDLNATLAETHSMLDRLLEEDIAVLLRPAQALGKVKADPSQVEQIILNLVINARDAMPEGGTLTLETANVEFDDHYAATHPPTTPGPYVMLAVSDTGSGMDADTRRRIFDPFFTTKPEGKGTGLGLASVYGIVKQSGGFIWVYSEPGRGTTFKVYLPRVEEPADSALNRVAPAPTSPGHETILLVEDAAELRAVPQGALEELGYTVLLAANGREALALAQKHQGPIDLLLTDIVMPELDGGELAQLLAASRPTMRVLYMSGYTNGAISQHGLLGQGVVLLEKPFTRDKLAQAVRETLDRPGRA